MAMAPATASRLPTKVPPLASGPPAARTAPPPKLSTTAAIMTIPTRSRRNRNEPVATKICVVVTKNTELASDISCREVIQLAKCTAKNAPAGKENAPSPEQESITPTGNADAEESGGWLSTTLAAAGGIGIVAGLIGGGASGLALGLAYYAVETTGSANVIPADYKALAAPGAFLSVAGLAVGLGTAVIGAGLGAASMVVE